MTLGAAHTARVHDRVCSWRQANLKQMDTGKFLILTQRDAAFNQRANQPTHTSCHALEATPFHRSR